MNRVDLSEGRMITVGLLCQPVFQTWQGMKQMHYSLISVTIAVRF